VQKLVEWS